MQPCSIKPVCQAVLLTDDAATVALTTLSSVLVEAPVAYSF